MHFVFTLKTQEQNSASGFFQFTNKKKKKDFSTIIKGPFFNQQLQYYFLLSLSFINIYCVLLHVNNNIIKKKKAVFCKSS